MADALRAGSRKCCRFWRNVAKLNSVSNLGVNGGLRAWGRRQTWYPRLSHVSRLSSRTMRF